MDFTPNERRRRCSDDAIGLRLCGGGGGLFWSLSNYYCSVMGSIGSWGFSCREHGVAELWNLACSMSGKRVQVEWLHTVKMMLALDAISVSLENTYVDSQLWISLKKLVREDVHTRMYCAVANRKWLSWVDCIIVCHQVQHLSGCCYTAYLTPEF